MAFHVSVFDDIKLNQCHHAFDDHHHKSQQYYNARVFNNNERDKKQPFDFSDGDDECV